jgi:RimJ/RimL family protein N-acetyltransferase
MLRDTDRYFLRTPRLLFRHWTESDLELALTLWGDPVVTEWIGGPFSAAAVRERLDREIATQRIYGVQYWPIFRRADGPPRDLPGDGAHPDGIHLGCCGIRPYHPEAGIYELGFHLRAEHWGQGYATEAARAVIAYAFDTLRASALFAGHHPLNTASRTLLTRLGFRYTHDEFYPPTGLDHPSYRIRDSGFGIQGRRRIHPDP